MMSYSVPFLLGLTLLAFAKRMDSLSFVYAGRALTGKRAIVDFVIWETNSTKNAVKLHKASKPIVCACKQAKKWQ